MCFPLLTCKRGGAALETRLESRASLAQSATLSFPPLVSAASRPTTSKRSHPNTRKSAVHDEVSLCGQERIIWSVRSVFFSSFLLFFSVPVRFASLHFTSLTSSYLDRSSARFLSTQKSLWFWFWSAYSVVEWLCSIA